MTRHHSFTDLSRPSGRGTLSTNPRCRPENATSRERHVKIHVIPRLCVVLWRWETNTVNRTITLQQKKKKEMWVPLTVAIFVFVFFVKPKTWLVGFLTFLLLRYSRLSSVSVLLLLHVRNNVNICLWIKQFSSWSTWRSVNYCILISAVYWRESGELNLTSDSQCCQSFHQTFDSNAPAKQFITFWKSLVNNRM